MYPLPLYSVWPYTPVIPAFYWDAKSTEEIIKHLACEYDHITAYFDTLATAISGAGVSCCQSELPRPVADSTSHAR